MKHTWWGTALLLLLCMLVHFLLVWLVVLFVAFVAWVLGPQVLATGVRVWLHWGRWRRSSSLCACCGAEWSVSSPASSAATSYSGGASSWSECSWTSFHGTSGRFSLCCASLEPLAASHVLAECLSSRIDLTQTASTSKAGLIVCTYDVI